MRWEVLNKAGECIATIETEDDNPSDDELREAMETEGLSLNDVVAFSALDYDEGYGFAAIDENDMDVYTIEPEDDDYEY